MPNILDPGRAKYARRCLDSLPGSFTADLSAFRLQSRLGRSRFLGRLGLLGWSELGRPMMTEHSP